MYISHKKYYSYRKPRESYSFKFNDDLEIGRIEVGTLFAIGYQDEKFYIVKINWGTEWDWERSRNGKMEMSWDFDEKNTGEFMLRTGSHNTKDMIKAMYERFGNYRDFADFRIEKWCKEKEIEYSYYVHY